MRAMGLTGAPLLVLSVLLAVAAPVGCLLLWNRLVGPPVVLLGGRIALIAACQATVLLLAGLTVNSTFQLYDSWGELFGWSATGGGLIRPAGGDFRGEVAGVAPVRPSGAEPGRVRFVFDTEYRTWDATVTGPASHVRSQLRVWVPPQYDMPQFRSVKFPVVELFPGFPGTPGTWFAGLNGGNALVERMGAGQAKPFILVAPVMTVQPGRDTECTDIPGGPQVATWLTRDVREIVTAHFRAIPGTGSWATMGYSSGGFCAAKLTLQFPQLFHAAVSMSGYFDPAGPDLTRNRELGRANSPFELIKAGPPVSLLLAGTQQDAGTAADAEQMMRDSKGATRVAVYILPQGGHNTRVWKQMLPKTYEWLSQQLAGSA